MSEYRVVAYNGKWPKKLTKKDLKDFSEEVRMTRDMHRGVLPSCFAVKLSGVDYDVELEPGCFHLHQLFEKPDGGMATHPMAYAEIERVWDE